MKTILCFGILFAVVGSVNFGQTKANLTVELNRGSAYTQMVPMGFGQTEITPHIAVWLESPKGDYIGTLFVSLKDGKQDFWVGNRPHPLPAWQKAIGERPLLDAIASASPAPKAPQALIFKRSLPIENKDYVLNIEVNMAFDFNKDYKKELYDPWGQPSILYSTSLNPSKPEAKILEAPTSLVFPGTRTIVNYLKGIDSASKILKSIKLTWN